MYEGKYGFPRLTDLGPFVESSSEDCPDEFVQYNWYSNILEKWVTIGNLSKEDVKQAFEERYDQDYDELTERLGHTFGMYVATRGQPLFIAEERHPKGLAMDERIDWIEDNSEDEELIEGYRNLQELNQQLVKEMPFNPCIYRGLHGEIASYLKLQYRKRDELVYFTRAVEFWSVDIDESVAFSTEGIGRSKGKVEDAVIISTRLQPKDLFELNKTEVRLMPTTESITINADNFWVVK